MTGGQMTGHMTGSHDHDRRVGQVTFWMTWPDRTPGQVSGHLMTGKWSVSKALYQTMARHVWPFYWKHQPPPISKILSFLLFPKNFFTKNVHKMFFGHLFIGPIFNGFFTFLHHLSTWLCYYQISKRWCGSIVQGM